LFIVHHCDQAAVAYKAFGTQLGHLIEWYGPHSGILRHNAQLVADNLKLALGETAVLAYVSFKDEEGCLLAMGILQLRLNSHERSPSLVCAGSFAALPVTLRSHHTRYWSISLKL